jgi:hypothetical protein
MKLIGDSKTKRLSVYDPKSEKFIADFVDGLFETDNEEIAKRLQEMGYALIPESTDVPVEPEIEPEAEEEVKRKRGRPKKIKEQET